MATATAKSKRDEALAHKKAWDTRGRKQFVAALARRRGRKAGAGGGGGIRGEQITKTPPPPHRPNVETDRDGDGVTDAARVGVPADQVPPPPKIGRLPNLTPDERAVETAFAEAFEKDPDGMARDYMKLVQASKSPTTYEVDAAKNLFDAWRGEGKTPEERAEFRSTMNTALHQTANAIAKRAFLMHLDSMSPEERAKGLLVTVGGCGAGKGYALKTLSKDHAEFDSSKYGATWDSAGDQNATENPWLLKEAKKRGIPVTYAYISADPRVTWAGNEKRGGVVQRAANPDDGRMVDSHVFVDSYVLGARNHSAFAKKHGKDANFIYVSSGESISRIDSVPQSDTSRSRWSLRKFAVARINKLGSTIPRRILRGALVGQRIWRTGT